MSDHFNTTQPVGKSFRAIVLRVGCTGLMVAMMAVGFAAEKPKSKPDLTLPEAQERIADASIQAQACIECHQEIADLLEGDKHIARDFHCVVCHGESRAHLEMEEEGTLPDRAWRRWDEEKNAYQWRMKNASLEIARFCASCHGRKPETDKDKDQKISTIDWKDFLDTGHGLGVAHGDHDAATCTDCHYAHGAGCEPLTDETVIQRCALCHADEEMMERAGIDPDVMKEFSAGTHGEMQMATPEEKSSCIRCHYPH